MARSASPFHAKWLVSRRMLGKVGRQVRNPVGSSALNFRDGKLARNLVAAASVARERQTGTAGVLERISLLIHNMDILLRGLGLFASFVAILGLWNTKKFGYYAALCASSFEVLLRLLIYLPNARYASQSYPPAANISKLANLPGVFIFVAISAKGTTPICT